MTSLMIPNSSKYPPRPCVPNGSLNVIVTLAMESRFHVGPKIMLEKRRDIRFWTISLPNKDCIRKVMSLQNCVLTKVMVDPVELVLAEEFLQVQREICRAVRVLSKECGGGVILWPHAATLGFVTFPKGFSTMTLVQPVGAIQAAFGRRE